MSERPTRVRPDKLAANSNPQNALALYNSTTCARDFRGRALGNHEGDRAEASIVVVVAAVTNADAPCRARHPRAEPGKQPWVQSAPWGFAPLRSFAAWMTHGLRRDSDSNGDTRNCAEQIVQRIHLAIARGLNGCAQRIELRQGRFFPAKVKRGSRRGIVLEQIRAHAIRAAFHAQTPGGAANTSSISSGRR